MKGGIAMFSSGGESGDPTRGGDRGEGGWTSTAALIALADALDMSLDELVDRLVAVGRQARREATDDRPCPGRISDAGSFADPARR